MTSPADTGRAQFGPRPGAAQGRRAPQGGAAETDLHWVSPYPRRRSRNFMIARLRWIAFVTLAVIAGAAAMSWSRTPMYQSSADVLVQPRMFAAATPPQVPDMGSEREVAESATVIAIAATMLHVSPDTVSNGLSASVPLNTHVLQISYTSGDPVLAQQRAQAAAEAYVQYWIAQQPALTSGRDPGPKVLNSAVISNARVSKTPVSPNHSLDLAIALVIGLALGIGTAYLRDRLDDRVRGAADLEQQVGGAAVLAVTPHRWTIPGRHATPLCEPGSTGAAAYNDLAVFFLRRAAARPEHTILVTAASASTQVTVSANLAVALAGTGRRVLLVHGDLRNPLSCELFDSNPMVGLADVLEGRIAVSEALQPTGVVDLLELPTGVLNGNPGGVLHGFGLRQTLRRLAKMADVVVIDGPAVLAGADIAPFVDVADVVLLAADRRRTTRAEARAAAAQLAALPDKVAGWVLVNDRSSFRRPAQTGRRHVAAPPPVATDDAAAELLAELGGAADPDPTEDTKQLNGWPGPVTTAKR
jgi:succinoglycan biosynthesis transport protein ExoP